MEISSRDLTQFLNLYHLKKPDYQPNLWNWCPFPTPTCICNLHGSTCLALAHSQTFSRQWGLGGQLVFQLGTEYCVTYRHGGRWSMSVVWGRRGVRFWCRGRKSVVSFVHSYSRRKIRYPEADTRNDPPPSLKESACASWVTDVDNKLGLRKHGMHCKK